MHSDSDLPQHDFFSKDPGKFTPHSDMEPILPTAELFLNAIDGSAELRLRWRAFMRMLLRGGTGNIPRRQRLFLKGERVRPGNHGKRGAANRSGRFARDR